MSHAVPTIVERSNFTVIGLEYVGPMDNFKGISGLWGKYTGRAAEIPSKQGTNKAFGVFYNTPDQVEIGETSYIACAEVPPDTKAPKDMEKITVPGGTFVTLTHRGVLTDLPKAFQSVFKWIADSPCETTGAPGYELYDERFDASSPQCEIDIFIPVNA